MLQSWPTTMPGCAEVIRDGWNGFLVPPGAPRTLAARILDLLGNRENGRAMAVRAAERVQKESALETVVARQAALYRELIDRSRGLKDDTRTPEHGVAHAVRYRDECTSRARPTVRRSSSIGRECIASAKLCV